MLSEYSISQNGQKSTVQFVAGKDGKAAQLYYEDNNGALNKDHLLGGLILLSGDSTVIDNASDGGTTVQGYALMQKPFVITEGHKVFTNSETDVALKLSELKKQGYDGFIFDYHEGDRYAVMVFNDAQVVTPAEFANYQKNQQFQMLSPVEQTDKLVAVHNKSVSGLRRMLRRGGVPVPSIAIEKAGTPFFLLRAGGASLYDRLR